MPNRLLSTEETAERLGLSRSAIFALIRDGDIVSVKIGSRRLVPETEIDAYVDRLVAASRAAQGLPPRVEDPSVLDCAARLLADEEAPDAA